jgi:GT2 family glycosyltransferase
MINWDEIITCVVLNWNGNSEILKCAESLQASKGVTLDIVVVDNGSRDDSVPLLEKGFPEVHIIRHSRNIGLSRARNEAIRWALERNSAFVFLIDDDAYVSQECLRLLLEVTMTSHDIGIVTPRILDGKTEDKIWFDGGFTNLFGDTVHRNMRKRVGLPGGIDPLATFEEEFASGCSMLIRREVFETVGLFNEEYFVYSEDADFSFRSREQGFKILHVPSASAWHHQSSDTKRNKGKWFRDYYVTRNKLLLVRGQKRGLGWILFLGYFGVRHLLIPIGYFLLTAQFKRISAVISGVVDFVCGRFGERYV